MNWREKTVSDVTDMMIKESKRPIQVLKTLGFIAVAATIIVDTYVSYLDARGKKEYKQMIMIADNRSLHPSYGNNNRVFDHREFEGICKELGIEAREGEKIPLHLVKKYIGMYKK